MANKIVKVYVVDNKNYTLSNQRVKTYNGDEKRTNEEGFVSLSLPVSGDVSIYINGFSAYNGSISNLDSEEYFTKSGGHP
jgi:hypothetical protein